MSRKYQGHYIRSILLFNKNGYWEKRDHRIYFQIANNPRKLMLPDKDIVTTKNTRDNKVEYIFGIISSHKRYCKKLNKILDGIH